VPAALYLVGPSLFDTPWRCCKHSGICIQTRDSDRLSRNASTIRLGTDETFSQPPPQFKAARPDTRGHNVAKAKSTKPVLFSTARLRPGYRDELQLILLRRPSNPLRAVETLLLFEIGRQLRLALACSLRRLRLSSSLFRVLHNRQPPASQWNLLILSGLVDIFEENRSCHAAPGPLARRYGPRGDGRRRAAHPLQESPPSRLWCVPHLMRSLWNPRALLEHHSEQAENPRHCASAPQG